MVCFQCPHVFIYVNCVIYVTSNLWRLLEMCLRFEMSHFLQFVDCFVLVITTSEIQGLASRVEANVRLEIALLQAIDPFHNIYFLHSSSFMPFRSLKPLTCKTDKLLDSNWYIAWGYLSQCLSQPSPRSQLPTTKTTHPLCSCITSGAGKYTWLSLRDQKQRW